MLNLLRAVASTADEISLAGVLRSPFFALADETLFWLTDSTDNAQRRPVRRSATASTSTGRTRKGRLAAATIAHLRAIKDRVPIATLLNTALDRTGYDAVLLAEFLGERKLANLNKLHRTRPHRRPKRHNRSRRLHHAALSVCRTRAQRIARRDSARSGRRHPPDDHPPRQGPRVPVRHRSRFRSPAPAPSAGGRVASGSWPTRTAPVRRRRRKNHHWHDASSQRSSAARNSKNANACCTSPAPAPPTTSCSPAASKTSRNQEATG